LPDQSAATKTDLGLTQPAVRFFKPKQNWNSALRRYMPNRFRYLAIFFVWARLDPSCTVFALAPAATEKQCLGCSDGSRRIRIEKMGSTGAVAFPTQSSIEADCLDSDPARAKIGRAHVLTPVTRSSRMPS